MLKHDCSCTKQTDHISSLVTAYMHLVVSSLGTSYHIAGIFRGVKFGFEVERQAIKLLPTKHYHIVPGCGLVYCDHETFSINCPKFTAHENFTPLKNTRYTVC